MNHIYFIHHRRCLRPSLLPLSVFTASPRRTPHHCLTSSKCRQPRKPSRSVTDFAT
ncbi:hypothetical protein E2C01_010967 [Portunus trituberculatus]|uniref:Uncharacterized protein n=1 Tax=Portunus trituberculatus TaxID=210409 RepID=A0A5B7DA50_PORTR|nr:hypothetical protein [Portunus trituberculatus]